MIGVGHFHILWLLMIHSIGWRWRCKVWRRWGKKLSATLHHAIKLMPTHSSRWNDRTTSIHYRSTHPTRWSAITIRLVSTILTLALFSTFHIRRETFTILFETLGFLTLTAHTMDLRWSLLIHCHVSSWHWMTTSELRRRWCTAVRLMDRRACLMMILGILLMTSIALLIKRTTLSTINLP